MTPLEQLAEWTSHLTPADIPESQHRLVRLRILDTIGLIATALNQPVGHSLAAWAAANPGAGATIITTGASASPAAAALVHGSLAHARDFDDTFLDSVIHPGSTVIATALALGEARDASFDELSSAIVVGYEIAARLGAAAGRKFHARGFHATSLIGPIAAAATAAYILKLDAGKTADAMALATSMSSGLLAFLADGGWSKWMHTGWSAHGGLIAAELASHAFRGPRHALDHRYGLYGAFLSDEQIDLGAITANLGNDWCGSTARFKSFPCAHVIQPYVEETLWKRASGHFTVDSVRSINCVMAPWAMPLVGEPRESKIAPRNDLEAIASLPFMVAAALCDGHVGVSTLQPETIARADIHAVAARITCTSDERLGAGFDGRMEVVCADGDEHTYPVSMPPMKDERITAKFRANTVYAPRGALVELEYPLMAEKPDARTIVRIGTKLMTGRDSGHP